eukprot:GHVS01038610.1.p1 GENE.GHVS01038610.1~~GHVS01038610.1.p1  ORF type:complete len:650 (-),score=139.82 GHVS01038610.1:142-2091(-)
MLGSISEKLWGSQSLVSDPDIISPGCSTVASSIEQHAVVGVADVTCSVWEVDGNDAKETIGDAAVSLEECKVVFTGKSEMEFRYADIVAFHRQEHEIFQWLIKSKESVEEYGVVFPNVEQAELFSAAIRPLLRETADVVCKEPVEFREYKCKEWHTVAENATMVILQRAKDKEAYLYVFEASSGEERVLSEIGVSQEEYIFPQKEEEQICWWGHSADEGADRKMYAGKVLGGGVDRIFEVLRRLMREHSGCEEEEQYDNKDFVMQTESEEVEWLDAEEILPSAVLSRDTSRRIAADNPNSKLHKLMFVGSNRTFVVRGGAVSTGRSLSGGYGVSAELQVMKISGEGGQELVGTITDDKLAIDGQQLCPNKAMLHDNETKMMLLDESDNSRVFMLDIDKETVVQSWDAGTSVQNILPSKAKMTRDPTFLGTNSNSLFTLDTRMSDKPAKTASLCYATNVQFTAAATDVHGHVLLGSKMGDLRLYDGELNKEGKLKRAKTHLPGLGDPLLHVAVTKEGTWVLGTCAKYLVLFPVKLSGSGKTGFETALGKSKPPPVVLKLSMEDVIKYELSDVHFSKAEFNDEETAIVTSTGNLAVIWDFSSAVNSGGGGGYIVRAVDDYIKEVDFVKTGGTKESIVMATPCDLTTKNIKA